jgi:hypothetical protein
VRRKALLAVAGVLHLSCQAILTAPAGSTLALFVNPPFVESHGGVSVVTAVVTESIGTPVADGTVVQFFTTLGRIEEQGRTNDGVARVNFVSDSRSGIASITAMSGAATLEEAVEIEVGGVRPVRVQVTAEPRRMTDSRSSQITAIVIDRNGNPVPNIGVFFSVEGEATEFMESGGQMVFTDNDGRARDVLRTRYPFGAPGRVVTVVATPAATPGSGGSDGTPASLSGEVDVFIN